MGLFTNKKLDSFDCLFLDQLEDLYDAEQRLTQALPKMAEAAHAGTLKAAFEQHLRETQNQVARLEKVFQLLGKHPQRHTCAAMKGLIEEGQEVIGASGDESVIDAATHCGCPARRALRDFRLWHGDGPSRSTWGTVRRRPSYKKRSRKKRPRTKSSRHWLSSK